MRTRTLALVVTFVLVAVAAGSGAAAAGPVAHGGADLAPGDGVTPDDGTVAHGGVPSSDAAPVEPCAADQPDDFADPAGGTEDTIGWVEGYWYDEPLDIDTTDGLTEAELEALSARTAARFEAMRCLTVQDGLPPVEIVPREEFAQDQSEQFDAVGETERQVENAKFETMLAVDSQTDVVDLRAADTAERVGGFYDFVANEIVVVSDDPDALQLDEGVLAHELGHAIQDQQFGLAGYDRPTTDRDAGKLGLIEGDVDLVEHEYLGACAAGAWAEPCETDDAGTGSADVVNWAIYFEGIQPYSDGPSFVDDIREEGGWEAVDALYDDPPTSALHTVFPETYGEVEPRDLDTPDTSTDEWDRLDATRSSTHDTLGISAITGMFAAPALEEETDGAVLSDLSVYNFDDDGSVDLFNPHEYAHPETEGWRGDELHVYANSAGETATVWELAWASPADADPFVEGYDQLVEIRGGERVEGYEHTYSFDAETGYEMAVTVVPDGERVTVVTAPTVEDLTAVDQGLELLEADGQSDESTGTGEETGEAGDGEGETGEVGDGEGDGSGDGVGPEIVVLPVLGAGLLFVLVLVAAPAGRE